MTNDLVSILNIPPGMIAQMNFTTSSVKRTTPKTNITISFVNAPIYPNASSVCKTLATISKNPSSSSLSSTSLLNNYLQANPDALPKVTTGSLSSSTDEVAKSDENGGLSGGAIGGIVAGAVVGVLVVGLVVAVVVIKRPTNKVTALEVQSKLEEGAQKPGKEEVNSAPKKKTTNGTKKTTKKTTSKKSTAKK